MYLISVVNCGLNERGQAYRQKKMSVSDIIILIVLPTLRRKEFNRSLFLILSHLCMSLRKWV